MDKIQTLNNYLDYLTARGQSKNYYNTMKVLLDYLENTKIEIENITQETITQFFTANSTYSNNTRNMFIKAGRSFYKFLNIADENNEWKKIKLLKVTAKQPDYLDEKDIAEAKKYLITYHSKRLSIIKIEALIDFMFHSAPRKNEILLLKRADFDLANCSVKVLGKGDKERILYFPKETKDKIEIYFQSEPEITNAFNMSLGKLNYLPKVISKHLGKNVYMHLFRHSSCRYMQRQGIPLAVVKDIMGHASIQTTMIYSGENEEGRRNEYKKHMG